MISKKSRKVVAALLIGATMCASGTFAYFNYKADLSNLTNVADTAQSTLQIVNGHVEIAGKLANITAAESSSYWTYDIARVGATGALDAQTNGVTDQSPDITVGGTKLSDAADAINDNGVKRAKIGAAINGSVTLARPGDAIVLGASSTNALDGSFNDDAGIVIVNKSNITTKVGMRLNLAKDADSKTIAEQINAITALKNAGWKVYLKISGFTSPTTNPYATYTEIDPSNLVNSTFELGTLAPTKDITNGTDTSIKIQVRVELPRLTGNLKQDKDTSKLDDATTDLSFDIANLFEIVATQENNPGWTQAGTTPAEGEAFTNNKDTANEGVKDKDTNVADPNDKI